MSEEKDGAEAQASVMPDTAGLAIDLAMEQARSDPALRGEVAAFLRNQNSLIDVQKHHLHEQFKQVRLATLGQRLSIALKMATGAVGLVLIAGLGIATWNASQASGLVVEAFTVPPQFAQAGVTGEVLSDDLNNKLGVIRDTANTTTLTRSGDVSANRDDDIKVEIPETGISLAQAWRYLRLWFGHERRLRGNLRAIGDGKIALSVALDDTNPLTVTGPAEDLDRLEQEAAEHVYADVDPVNYGVYLGTLDHQPGLSAAAERATRLAVGPVERANAFSFWSSATRRMDPRLSIMRARIALAINPKTMAAYGELSTGLLVLGHDEEALQAARAMQDQREEDQPASMHGRGFADLVNEAELLQAVALGDFARAARGESANGVARGLLTQAEYAARGHDTARSRMLIDQVAAAGAPPARISFSRRTLNSARYYLDAATGNWPGAEAEARAYIAAIKADAVRRQLPDGIPATTTMPMLALALAHNGDFKGAHAAADPLPQDCYACLRVRGEIAALEKNGPGADGWFARAVKAAPSLPFAYADWGQALLARGRPDKAIAQFTTANQQGPHFADALEGVGRGVDGEKSVASGAGEIHRSREIRPQLGPAASEVGRGPRLCGRDG